MFFTFLADKMGIAHSLFLRKVPLVDHTCLWHCYTVPADHFGCVHWHWGRKHNANTKHATLTYTDTRSFVISLPFLSERKKLLGLWQHLYLAVAALFRCSDVSSCFYQVILSGRQPRTAALFILCYGDGGILSPDHHFDDMQRRGEAPFTAHICCHWCFPSCCDHRVEQSTHKWDACVERPALQGGEIGAYVCAKGHV